MRKKMSRMTAFVILFLGVFTATHQVHAGGDSRDTLKTIVQNCDKQYQTDGRSGECAFLNHDVGYAMLKTRNDKNQYLLLPLTIISGIEDKKLLTSFGVPYFYQVPAYFYAAWQSRMLVMAAYHNSTGKILPEKYISLVVNPVNSRTQDQLHIHVSCLKPAIRTELDNENPDFYRAGWTSLIIGNNLHYDALVLTHAEFRIRNLFDLIQDKYKDEAQYAEMTVVLLKDGQFLLLTRKGNALQKIPAEELQDHSCSI